MRVRNFLEQNVFRLKEITTMFSKYLTIEGDIIINPRFTFPLV